MCYSDLTINCNIFKNCFGLLTFVTSEIKHYLVKITFNINLRYVTIKTLYIGAYSQLLLILLLWLQIKKLLI